ncbi:hypothetical protein [Acuticoccus kandeliae]|uniref:hypothetical protein n=1 Tax=Acuticoccus kandeliae TaxID=2073160 RepID=UPI001300674E|nr:hypothetical protein [Acuticoccus kandeliae]
MLSSSGPCTISVGGGWGFLVEVAGERLVVAAAHCLPGVPGSTPRHDNSYAVTYEFILGELDGDLGVSARLILADAGADIAVLGKPAEGRSPELAAEYDKFAGRFLPLPVTSAEAVAFGYVPLSGGAWIGSRIVDQDERFLDLLADSGSLSDVCSGAPIVTASGAVVGMFRRNARQSSTRPGPHPKVRQILSMVAEVKDATPPAGSD